MNRTSYSVIYLLDQIPPQEIYIKATAATATDATIDRPGQMAAAPAGSSVGSLSSPVCEAEGEADSSAPEPGAVPEPFVYR